MLQSYWGSRQGEHSYLEEVEGAQALSWVKERNSHCLDFAGNPRENPLYGKILNILESKDKIPHVSKHGEWYYNFWTDDTNIKGLLRKTTPEEYFKAEPKWQTVLDIDALAASEGEPWVYKTYTLYEPDEGFASEPGREPRRMLVQLSRGGGDAVVVREFDLISLRFIPTEEGGFNIKEGKNSVNWKSENELYVGVDLGDGESMTTSGYPRIVREWRRGTPIEEAVSVFEGKETDVYVYGYAVRVISLLSLFSLRLCVYVCICVCVYGCVCVYVFLCSRCIEDTRWSFAFKLKHSTIRRSMLDCTVVAQGWDSIPRSNIPGSFSLSQRLTYHT